MQDSRILIGITTCPLEKTFINYEYLHGGYTNKYNL